MDHFFDYLVNNSLREPELDCEKYDDPNNIVTEFVEHPLKWKDYRFIPHTEDEYWDKYFPLDKWAEREEQKTKKQKVYG